VDSENVCSSGRRSNVEGSWGICADEELRKIYLDAWNADNQKDLEKGAQAFLCSLRSRDWGGMQDVSSIPGLLDLDMSDMPGALRHRRRCSY
jgi:hypothetical protein